MIHAHVPTQRFKPDWKEVIKSREDYKRWLDSGMYYVYFDDVDNEIKEWLDKERDVE